MKRVVLDESALLAFLWDYPGASDVEELLNRALLGQVIVFVPMSAWSSVCSAVWRAKGKASGEPLLRQLCQLPLSFIELDHSGAQRAAELAEESDVSVLMSFAAAIACQRKATLITAERIPQSLSRQVRVQNIEGAGKD
jgi:PIN domain nuclease of toxin-antitoxin system